MRSLLIFQLICSGALFSSIHCQVRAPDCSKDLNPGSRQCFGSRNEDGGRRWYYSKELNRCLTFEFSGCEGNSNKFNSLKECISSCYPQDGSACSPGSKSYGSCSPSDKGNQCGPQSVCKMGFMRQGGLCCDKQNEKFWDQSYDVLCPDGSYAEPDVVAKTCKNLVCSEGFQCSQINPVFAKCCSGKSKPRNEFSDTTESKNSSKLDRSCVDEHYLCLQWATHNHCYINPGYMLNHCQRSCNSCGGVKPRVWRRLLLLK